MLDMKEFGSKLRQIREEKKLTRKAILETHGVTVETLRKLEKGLVIPQLQTLQVLSIAYHTDLILLFNQYKSQNILVNTQDLVDKLLIEHANTVDSLEDYMIDESYLSDVNKLDVIEVKQFNSLCKLIPLTNTDSIDKSEIAINGLIDSIKLHHEDYQLENTSAYSYTYMELRLLLVLGITLAHIKRLNESEIIFLEIEKQLDINAFSSSMAKKLYVKLLFNMAYNYHIKDKNEKVLEITDKCLDFLNKFDSSYYMEVILYRKAVAQHNLGLKDKMRTFSHVRAIMEIKGLHKQLELYADITRKRYNIEL